VCAFLKDVMLSMGRNGTHQVSVANLQSLVDAVSDLAGRSLPGAISQLPIAQKLVSPALCSSIEQAYGIL
jgi:hypothetical protein